VRASVSFAFVVVSRFLKFVFALVSSESYSCSVHKRQEYYLTDLGLFYCWAFEQTSLPVNRFIENCKREGWKPQNITSVTRWYMQEVHLMLNGCSWGRRSKRSSICFVRRWSVTEPCHDKLAARSRDKWRRRAHMSFTAKAPVQILAACRSDCRHFDAFAATVSIDLVLTLIGRGWLDICLTLSLSTA